MTSDVIGSFKMYPLLLLYLYIIVSICVTVTVDGIGNVSTME